MSEEVKDPDILKKLNGGTVAAAPPEHPILKAAKRIAQTTGDFSRAAAESVTLGAVNAIPAGISAVAHGTKFADELAKQHQESLEARRRSPVASIGGLLAGSAIPATGISKALGTGVKALGKTTLPSIMGNQAVTGAGMSALDSASQGEMPDPRKMATAGAASGVVAGPVAAAARLFPGPAVRHAGRYFDAAAKSKVLNVADRAKGLGVPLSATEAATAVDPVAAGPVNALMESASRLHEGAHAANRFNAAREPIISATAKRMSGILSSGAHPVEIQGAATKAIHDSENLVRNSAKPYYDQARSNLVAGIPKSKAVGEATSKVLKNPIMMEDIGKIPRHSIKFSDAVKSQLQESERKTVDTNPYLAKLYRDTRGDLNDAMHKASPAYSTAEDITGKGNEMLVKPLKAGPLGAISSTTDKGAQAKALFNVGTGAEANASIDAIKRMETHLHGSGEGLLAHHIEDAAHRDPLGFASRVLPSDHAVSVATHAAGPKAAQIGDTLQALRQVNPVNRTPVLESHSSLWHDTLRHLQRTSAHGVVDRLNNPETAKNFGQLAGLQQLLHGMTTAQIAAYLAKLKFAPAGNP